MLNAEATAAPHPHLGLRSSPGWCSQVPFIFLPNPRGVWTSICRQPPPSRLPTSGRVPFQSGPVKASPGSTISSFWFPSSAHMRQQVSRPQIIFSSPRERARFVSFCAIRRRPRRVWAGHGWVRGSLASVAGALPRSSRVRGPRPSRLLPRTCLGDPGGPAVLHAGGPARRGRAAAGPSGPAAVATGAHSISTCRRTLSITEATT